MVGHAENCDELLAALVNDAGDVLVQFFTPFGRDKVLSTLDGEDDLDVYLRIGIWHCWQAAPTGLTVFLDVVLQTGRSYGAFT